MLDDARLQASIQRIEASTVDPDIGSPGTPVGAKREGGVTIFVANWNHRPFLPRALRSAFEALASLEEHGLAGEIVVIDDGSRDGSQRLLRSVQALYEEPRLRTVSLRHNLGLPRLRNLSLELSEYRYVCMLDADNELVPHNLPLFLRAAVQTKAVITYGTLIGTENGQTVGAVSNMPPTLRLTRGNYIDAFSIVDAVRISRLGGFMRVHPYAPDDWEMLLHLVAEEELIVFVPTVLGYYHKVPMAGSRQLRPVGPGVDAIRRVHAQLGVRDWDDKVVGRMYHPDVGYLDEW